MPPRGANPFEDRGMSWSDIQECGELNAVLARRGSERLNLLLHSASLYASSIALKLVRRNGLSSALILDFGCGVGRIARVFSREGHRVIGTEVTMEMLSAAARFELPKNSLFALTDGVSIPVQDSSIDLVWVCGVLKYSLFPPDSPSRGGKPDPQNSQTFIPVYGDIAREMYRVLRPGGRVVNYEMWVDSPPEVFFPDFQKAGFISEDVRVLRRNNGRPERLWSWRQWRPLPPRLVMAAGRFSAAARFRLDNPRRRGIGFRDYLFVWRKPSA